MRRFSMHFRATLLATIVAAGAAGFSQPVMAQGDGPTVVPVQSSAGTPSPAVLETLLKRYILAFNHANITGNYAVFHALLHPRFSSRFDAERLSEIFTVFRRKKVDLGIVATMKPRIKPAPRIDEQGRMQITGWFPTRPSRVLFRMIFRRDGGTWKLTSIRVSVKRPKSAGDGGKIEKL